MSGKQIRVVWETCFFLGYQAVLPFQPQSDQSGKSFQWPRGFCSPRVLSKEHSPSIRNRDPVCGPPNSTRGAQPIIWINECKRPERTGLTLGRLERQSCSQKQKSQDPAETFHAGSERPQSVRAWLLLPSPIHQESQCWPPEIHSVL